MLKPSDYMARLIAEVGKGDIHSGVCRWLRCRRFWCGGDRLLVGRLKIEGERRPDLNEIRCELPNTYTSLQVSNQKPCQDFTCFIRVPDILQLVVPGWVFIQYQIKSCQICDKCRTSKASVASTPATSIKTSSPPLSRRGAMLAEYT